MDTDFDCEKKFVSKHLCLGKVPNDHKLLNSMTSSLENHNCTLQVKICHLDFDSLTAQGYQPLSVNMTDNGSVCSILSTTGLFPTHRKMLEQEMLSQNSYGVLTNSSMHAESCDLFTQ